MRERIDVGGVDGHHRIEEERQIDPLGLAGELERLAISVKRPGPFHGRDAQVGFVGQSEQPFFGDTVGCAVVDLHRAFADRHHRPDGGDRGGLQAHHRQSRFELAESDHGRFDGLRRRSSGCDGRCPRAHRGSTAYGRGT